MGIYLAADRFTCGPAACHGHVLWIALTLAKPCGAWAVEVMMTDAADARHGTECHNIMYRTLWQATQAVAHFVYGGPRGRVLLFMSADRWCIQGPELEWKL